MVGQLNMEKEILFSYRLSNADCCIDGDDDGFLFSIYSDSTAIYNKYVVENTIVKSRKFKVSNRTVSEIRGIIDRNKRKILSFDKNIDNGSCDGNFNKFIFAGKKIITLNICEDIEFIFLFNAADYIKHYRVIRQEKQIIRIFGEICAVLRKNHAIRLKLENVFIPIWLF